MARKPKNPINDISKLVGGWLGGSGPGTNPQVQAAMNATRAVGQVVDTATGGFGQALLSDARRMAQSGSSTPSALYKTAAVNLAAAATGAAAAKVTGRLTQNLSTRVGVHLSNTPNLNVVSFSPKRAGQGLSKNFEGTVEPGKTYKFSPFLGRTVGRFGRVAKEDIYTSRDLSDIVARTNVRMAEKTGNQTASYGYITKSRIGKSDDAFGRGWTEARTTGRQRVVSQVNLPRVAASATDTQKQANIRAVTNALADAFERRKQSQQTTAGIVTALSVQQGGLKKSRGGGKNKR